MLEFFVSLLLEQLNHLVGSSEICALVEFLLPFGTLGQRNGRLEATLTWLVRLKVLELELVWIIVVRIWLSSLIKVALTLLEFTAALRFTW